MNLKRIVHVLGQLQSVLGVFAQLLPDCRKVLEGTLKANGIDMALLEK